MKLNQYLPLFVVIIIFFIIRTFVITPLIDLVSPNNIPLIFVLTSNSETYTSFISEYLNLSTWFFIMMGGINLLLFYIVGNKISSKVGLLLSSVYAFSPWFIYAEASKSIYLISLTALLIIITSIREKNIGNKVLLIMAGILLSSLTIIGSVIYLFILFTFFYKSKKEFVIGTFSLIIFAFILLINNTNFKTVISNEWYIIKDPGIVDTINTFQGNLTAANWGVAAKIIINKITYYSLVLVNNLLTTLSPVTFFTAEQKLFAFSNLAPLSFALLIPFMYGIQYLLNIWQNKKKIVFIILIGSGLLLIPPVIGKRSEMLERLLLISPLIMGIIGFGLHNLIENKKKSMLYVVLILFILSTSITIADFFLKEPIRKMIFLS